MKKINKFIAVLALMVFLLVPTQSAQAQGPEGGGKLVFGENYTLKSGDTLGGDLVVFGGNVTLEQEAKVQGSIVVIGGNVDVAEGVEISRDTVMIGGNMKVDGTINGNLVIVGGQINLTDTAVVHGDISAIGGQIARDPKAQVDGKVMENVPAPTIEIPSPPAITNVPNLPSVPKPPKVDITFNPFVQAMGVVFRALAVAALAMLLTLFLQPQLERVSNAIVRQPVVAGSFGLLTAILSPFVILILIVTLILIPVAMLVVLVLPLAWLFGVIALGQEVGERFTKAIHQSWAPVLTAGFGAFLLMLVSGYIGLIPCFGWILPFLIGLMGVGGVMMTWFGSRPGPAFTSQPVEIPPAS